MVRTLAARELRRAGRAERILEAPRRRATRIADQDVQPAQALDCSLHQAAGHLGFPQIPGQAEHLDTGLGSDRTGSDRDAPGIPAVHRQPAAFAGQAECHGTTQPA